MKLLCLTVIALPPAGPLPTSAAAPRREPFSVSSLEPLLGLQNIDATLRPCVGPLRIHGLYNFLHTMNDHSHQKNKYPRDSELPVLQIIADSSLPTFTADGSRSGAKRLGFTRPGPFHISTLAKLVTKDLPVQTVHRDCKTPAPPWRTDSCATLRRFRWRIHSSTHEMGLRNISTSLGALEFR